MPLDVISQKHCLSCWRKNCHVWISRAHLPWKRPPQEVEQHVAQRLDVVPPRLLDAQVRVDAGIAGCSSEVLVLAVWDVDVGLGIAVLLGETKVDDVDLLMRRGVTNSVISGLAYRACLRLPSAGVSPGSCACQAP